MVIIKHEIDSFVLLLCISNKRNSDGEVILKGLEVLIDLDQENITQLGQQNFDLDLKLDDEIHFSDTSVMCYAIGLSFHNKYTIITSEWQHVVNVESMNAKDEKSSKLELCHYKI